jgi:hypothetical protein
MCRNVQKEGKSKENLGPFSGKLPSLLVNITPWDLPPYYGVQNQMQQAFTIAGSDHHIFPLSSVSQHQQPNKSSIRRT